MDLHDFIVNELIVQKSLSALIWLINCGRELDFHIDGAECFLSGSNAAKNVSLWVNHTEQSFDNMEELVEKATINEKRFLTVWNDAVIGTLY